MTESWPAPAKLNRFLHVTGRRPDGYHTLQTVFQFLSAHDLLRFGITDDGRITRATPLAGVPDDRDLTVRAARLLQAAGGTTRGAVIHLDKHLPLGGGLGGGSSDAATTLLALNHLWALNLDLDRLAALGLQLGADVPVFVRGQAAWAEGVGELLTPVDLPEDWMVVLVPPVSVSTAAVFTQFDRQFPTRSTSAIHGVVDREDHLTPASPPIRIRGFRAGQGRNDLEPVVRRLYPAVDKALTWLGKFGDARMTGSGACLFLPVENEAHGRTVLAECPPTLASGFVAQAMNRHPVHQRLYGK